MTTHTNDSWLKKIQSILINPALSTTQYFPFPWQEFEAQLQTLLNNDQISISSTSSSWQADPSYSILSFELSPILGNVHWAMSYDDISSLTSFSLCSTQEEGFADPRLEEGYYKFLILNLLKMINELKVFKDTSLKWVLFDGSLSEEYSCLDIFISLPSKTVQGKLILPSDFLEHFSHYKPFQTVSFLNNQTLQNKEVSLHFEIGKTVLPLESWQNIQVGDFLILDQAHYDPITHKGSLIISLNQIAILQGRIKPDGIKILDFLSIQEEPYIEEETSNIEIKIELEAATMPLKTVLELKQDSLIEIPPHPEQTVVITKQGKRVGQAELLKLGNITGVRVLKKDE